MRLAIMPWLLACHMLVHLVCIMGHALAYHMMYAYDALWCCMTMMYAFLTKTYQIVDFIHNIDYIWTPVFGCSNINLHNQMLDSFQYAYSKDGNVTQVLSTTHTSTKGSDDWEHSLMLDQFWRVFDNVWWNAILYKQTQVRSSMHSSDI